MIKKKTINGSSDSATSESSQKILLEEFQALQSGYLRLRSEGVARVNFFITATSVALGSVLVFGTSNNMPFYYFRLILLLTLSVLSVIGVEIHYYLIQRDISSDRHLRGLARIRNYFIHLDPNIKDSFVHNVREVPTVYIAKNSSGMRPTTQVVIGVFVGSIFALVSTFITSSDFIIFGLGISMVIITIFVLEIYARRKLKRVLKAAEKEINARA